MKGKRFAYVRYGRRTRKSVYFRLYLNRTPFPLLWQLVHQPLDSWHSEACITEYSAMNNNPISFNDPLGDTVRHIFRTEFLGIFGKKVTVDYNNGRQNVAGTNTAYTGKTRNYQKALLNDLSTLSSNTATSSMMGRLVNSTQVVQKKWGQY